jgi:hypothetical protein
MTGLWSGDELAAALSAAVGAAPNTDVSSARLHSAVMRPP